ERGVDDRVRFLRNVGGLWLLQESLRAWAEQGQLLELAPLLRQAAELSSCGPLIDVDDPRFIAPGDMPDRIRSAVAAQGHSLSTHPAATVRCIIQSLASSYAATVDRTVTLSDVDVGTIHI